MRELIQKAFSVMKPNLDEALGIRTDIVKKVRPVLFYSHYSVAQSHDLII